jgi:hypothetical protein
MEGNITTRKSSKKSVTSTDAPILREEGSVSPSSSLNKLELTIIQVDVYEYDGNSSTVYKVQARDTYKADGIVGVTDLTRTATRNLWVRFDDDNPLNKEVKDKFTILKSKWKLGISSWIDEDSGEEYSCTWMIPPSMPYGNLEATEW